MKLIIIVTYSTMLSIYVHTHTHTHTYHTHTPTHTHAMLGLVAQLCPNLCDPMNCSPPGSSVHGDSPGKNTGAGCHALLQGIFPTQGSNPGLLHCRQIFYHLSHQGIPWILVASPFSRESFLPRTLTRVSGIAGGFFNSWAPREANIYIHIHIWISHNIHIYMIYIYPLKDI